MSLLNTYSQYFFKVYKKIKLDQEYEFFDTLKSVISEKITFREKMLKRVQERISSLRNVKIELSFRPHLEGEIKGNYISDNTVLPHLPNGQMPQLPNDENSLSSRSFRNGNNLNHNAGHSFAKGQPGSDPSIFKIEEVMVDLREQINQSTIEIENVFDESMDELELEDEVMKFDDVNSMISHLNKGNNVSGNQKSGKKKEDDILIRPIQEYKGRKILDQYIDALSQNSQMFSKHSNPALKTYVDTDTNQSGTNIRYKPDVDEHGVELYTRNQRPIYDTINKKKIKIAPFSRIREVSEQYKVDTSEISSRNLLFSINPGNQTTRSQFTSSKPGQPIAGKKPSFAGVNSSSGNRIQTKIHSQSTSNSNPYKSHITAGKQKHNIFQSANDGLSDNRDSGYVQQSSFEKNLLGLQSGLKQFDKFNRQEKGKIDEHQRIINESNRKINEIVEFALKLISSSGHLDETLFESQDVLTFKEFLRSIGFTTPVPSNRLEILLIRMLIRELYLSYVCKMYVSERFRWENGLKSRVNSRVLELRPDRVLSVSGNSSQQSAAVNVQFG